MGTSGPGTGLTAQRAAPKATVAETQPGQFSRNPNRVPSIWIALEALGKQGVSGRHSGQGLTAGYPSLIPHELQTRTSALMSRPSRHSGVRNMEKQNGKQNAPTAVSATNMNSSTPKSTHPPAATW